MRSDGRIKDDMSGLWPFRDDYVTRRLVRLYSERFNLTTYQNVFNDISKSYYAFKITGKTYYIRRL